MSKVRNSVPLALCLTLAPLACSTASAHDVAGTSEAASATSSKPASLPRLPSPTLAVPEGNQLAFSFDAIGIQIYACQAAADGFAWQFQAPEASLVDVHDHGRVAVKHFAGPTWQSVSDGSKVMGQKTASFTENPKAIPALLLKANAHDGNGRMSDVTYIQRLQTTGGLAPEAGCDAANVGATAHADYAATYFFYRAK